MPERGELFDLHAEKVHLHSGEEMVRRWNLQPENFNGKTVLDVGSGPRTLEKYLKEIGIDSTLVSLDIDESRLEAREDSGLPVVGNYYAGLPFKDDSFDLVVNDAGPLQGNPITDKYLPEIQSVNRIYGEACRVLKPGGEIRIVDPFYDIRFGIGILLYWMAKEDRIKIPKDFDFAQFYDDPAEIDPDEEGYPLPIGKSAHFWDVLYGSRDVEYQKELCDEIIGYTQEKLRELGYITEITSIENKEPQDEEESEDYHFCMVIKMQEKLM